MKPSAFMLVGVPGSGKSTWAEPLLARENACHVSSDAYIEALAASMGKTYGEIFKSTIGKATKVMESNFRKACENMQTIVWDQTNLTPKSRRDKLAALKEAGYSVTAVAFECPAKELERRRLARAAATGKDVPPSVIESMTKNYVRPTLMEGFDKVIIVTPEGEQEVK